MTRQEWLQASEATRFECLTELFLRHKRSRAVAEDLAAAFVWPVDTERYTRAIQDVNPIEAGAMMSLMGWAQVRANDRHSPNFLAAIFDKCYRPEIKTVVQKAKELLARAEQG